MTAEDTAAATTPATTPGTTTPATRTPGTTTPATRTPATTTPATRTPATAPASSTSGAHCLYVGANHDVVRCYWTREECEGQLAFNKESGLTRPQECAAVAEPYCFQLDVGGENCFPTAADCERIDASMKKRHRQTSGCAAKTGR